MPTTESKNQEDVWQVALMRSRYLVGAIFLHLLVFFLVATLVIWKAPEPPVDASFKSFFVKVPPPPPVVPATGASANNPLMEPQPVVVPAVTPPSTITSINNTTFKVSAPSLSQALSRLPPLPAAGTGLGAAGAGDSLGTGSAFGSTTGSKAQFSGYFYDFKQTANREPTAMDESRYLSLLSKYVGSGWDESLFQSYYRSKSPLYTDHFSISTRPSEDAPKAFNLENEVQPGLWVIHYHAKVSVSQPGDYRLAGFGDNVLVVKVNGTIVLDAGWDSLTGNASLRQNLPFVFPSYIRFADGATHIPNLKMGRTFHLDVADPVDMDILIGDCGGVCSFFLLVQSMGTNYEKNPDGTLKLPFFQLSPGPAPTFSNEEEHPPFSSAPEPWGTSN